MTCCGAYIPCADWCRNRETSSDGDYMPGMPQPTGPAPPEPPGEFSPGMHTRKAYMAPGDVAAKAAHLISGGRAETHGDFRTNHANIGALWTAYLNARFSKAHCITLNPHDVACMMALLKIARTMTGSHNPDDYVDACGYAAIAGGIAEQDAAIADLTRREP